MAGFDFDPFKDSDPLRSPGGVSGMDLDPVARPRQRPIYRQPLDPERSESFGKSILNGGASGLNFVLGSLDKPGQAVRGVLAGKGSRSLLHLIPFSGSLGMTDEHDMTSGSDLTDSLGITSKPDKGWGAWGAGLAADLVTDPFTYSTFGAKHALTGAGKAASKAGALKGWSRQQLLKGFDGAESALRAAGASTDDIAHRIAQGYRIASPATESAMQAAGHSVVPGQSLSGLARVGVPFGPGVSLGTGQVAQRIAGGLDKLGEKLKYGTALGRTWNGLFDNTVHEATTPLTQRGASKHFHPALEGLQAQARTEQHGVLSQLDPLIRGGQFPEADITTAVRATGEGVPHSFDPGLTAQAAPIGTHIRDIEARQLQEAIDAGAPLRDLSDPFASYIPRHNLDVDSRALQMGGRNKGQLFPVVSGANISRDPLYTGIPGGSTRIDDWFKRFSANPDQAAVARALKKDMVLDLQAGGNQITRKLGKQFDEKATQFAERLANASDKYHAEGLPFYTPNIAGDVGMSGMQHARTIAAAKAAIGMLSDVAARRTAGDGMVPLSEAIKRIGLKTTKADQAAGTPIRGALVNMVRGLAPRGAPDVAGLLNGPRKALKKITDAYGIPESQLAEIIRAHQGFAAPEIIKGPLGAYDSLTNAFKAITYPIWIPSHIRNMFTAGTSNARKNTRLRDYVDQLQVMTGRGSRDLSHLIPGNPKGLSPAEQIDAVRRHQYGSASIFGGHGNADDILSAADSLRTGQGRFTPFVPGSDRAGASGNLAADTANLVLREGLLGSLKATGQSAWNLATHPLDLALPWRWNRLGQHLDPLAIKGVGATMRDANPAVRAGRTAGSNIEDFFRGALWNKEVRSGATPEMAAHSVHDLHFNYDALTGFEKNVMRRLVPFYTFARKNLPLQARTALTQPGVINAQYKPFYERGHEDNGNVPRYLASGVAIPTGPEVGGTRQYISKLGLPAEEAFERLHFKNGLPDVRSTALDYLSNLNPLIKGPLEQLFDTQFFTQRRLSDLKPQRTASAIGRLVGDDNPQLLSQILANSPVTRFVSSADKLLDERKAPWAKALNLLSGVRVTDVDTDKQRAIDLRGSLEDLMREHPNLSRHTSFYVRPQDVPNLTPEEVELMRYYSELQDRARAYTASQRRQIGVRRQ